MDVKHSSFLRILFGVCFLAPQLSFGLLLSKIDRSTPYKFVESIAHFSEFVHCEFFYVRVGNFDQRKFGEEHIVYGLAQQELSTGVFSVFLLETDNRVFPFYRARDVHKFTKLCGIAIILISENDSRQRKMLQLFKLLIPRYGAILRKDEDRFVLISDSDSSAKQLLLSEQFGNKIKYKIALVLKKSYEINVMVQTVDLYGNGGFPIVIILRFPKENTTSVCSVEVTDIFPDFTKCLHGKVFKMSIPKVAFRFEGEWRDGSFQPLRGYYKWWLDEAMIKFNFTYYMYETAGGGTGKILANGTWIGAVADILDGTGDWGYVVGHIYSRHVYVEWSGPLSYEWMVFLNHKPRTYLSSKAIFWPFTPLVWFLFLLTLVFIPLCFKLTAQLNSSSWSYWTMFEYIFASFLEQDHPGPYSIPLHSLRIVGAFWLLFAMIVSVLYRGKLVALLAFPVESWVPTTFEELANSQFRVGLNVVGKGGAAYSILSSSPSPVYRKLFEKMEFYPNADECLVKATKTDLCCIMWKGIADYIGARNLSDRYGNTPLQPSKETTSFIEDGIVWEKRAVYRQHLDRSIWSAVSMGLISRWFELDQRFIKKQRWLRKQSRKSKGTVATDYTDAADDEDKHKVKGPEKLQMTHLKGAFSIFLGGILLSFGYFLIEKLFPATLKCGCRNKQ